MRNPAVVFRGPCDAVVEDVGAVEPGPGELLVATRRSLISTGTEVAIYSGDFPPTSFWALNEYPFRPGYSNVGEVVAVGDGVDAARVGTRVVTPSTHARLVTASAADAVDVPEAVGDDAASFFTMAAIAMHGVRRGGIRWGDAVVVFGAGLVGQLCVRFARLCGARPVVAVDTADERLRLVAGPGVVTANALRDDLAGLVGAATRGRMADVVVEATGNHEVIPSEVALLRPEGRLLVVSGPRYPSTFHFHDHLLWPSITIVGAHVGSHPLHETAADPWTQRRNVELFLDLVAAGEIEVDRLITHRVAHGDAPAAFASLLRDRSGALGVVLEWG